MRQSTGHGVCSAANASLFALANGLIGVRGSLDELAERPDTIVPDAFIRRPIHYHEAFPGYARATETRILCPSPVLVRVTIDDAPVDFAAATIVAFARRLDLATGRLHRTTHWRLMDGREVEITATRLVPANGQAVVASRFQVRALNMSGDVVLTPDYGISNAVAEASADDPRISARLSPPWVRAEHGEGGTLFSCCDVQLIYRSSLDVTAGTARDGAAHRHLTPGQVVGFDRLVTISSAAADSGRGPLPSFDALAGQQAAALASYWQGADCEVAGDERLTRALRFALFQLFQSASRSAGHGLAAKGLTADGYEGHAFWDSEAFALPVLAFTAPALARTLLGFRIGTLGAARANARQLGFAHGALYPWRTISGGECSSHYPTGAAQVHINGDIAFAVKRYVDATGDDVLRLDAAEMLFETARFWIAIGHFDPRRRGAFCVSGVTGPDEYTALVDNDFFTNAVARLHLDYAAETAAWMHREHAARYQALARQLGLSDAEIAGWTTAAARMWLPVDAAQRINPQDDTFLGKPPFPGRPRVPGRPLLLDHHPMTLFRHQICKQGDVIQALAMELVEQPLSLTRRNYAFYEPLTSHDSTLSGPAFGVVAARSGLFADARRFLDETALVDLEDRHHNTGDGLHMAALAGGWLVLAHGWAGLAVRDGALHFAPRSAGELASYVLTVAWRGSRLRVAVDPAGATYTVTAGPPLTLADHGRPTTVGADPVHRTRPRVKAVIFDLDGVLTDTASHHCRAWAELADRHGLAFDAEFNRQLKGIDRAGSLRLLLERSGRRVTSIDFDALSAEKNAIYQAAIEAYSPSDLFDGVYELLKACRAAGVLTAIASASRNAGAVLARLGIADAFDFVADPAAVAAGKPAPDIFLACAAALGVPPALCVGVEDAQAGVDAIRAAGMKAVGIDPDRSLQGVDALVQTIGSLTMEAIASLV